ncbi:MAG: class IV adenylate cyclase [Methanospirillum sp.]|uniref:class IV adenylate cyclase n=1 Tax=Methanospirillum sp. TaxID=45200 RepID=UPI00236F3611|nr:class IV adenylate cyclase [Methanospirillum sp.]MDD1728461.1 class IV adenylate cyclase [Methanospirillum sp.]
MLEIEIKVRVPDINTVRERITACGGVLTEVLTEHDSYYNAPHRDFGVTDEALRLRETDTKTIVTYKGPKNTILGSKVREELNLEITDPGVFHSIITHLGFVMVAIVRKRREYYQYQDFTISLDQVEGLGDYVEIELISANDAEKAAARVDQTAQKMGVTGERITLSYLELLLSKR